MVPLEGELGKARQSKEGEGRRETNRTNRMERKERREGYVYTGVPNLPQL